MALPASATRDGVKGHGVHYTPPQLADFLARLVVSRLNPDERPISVLDPACGEGDLLLAIAHAAGGIGTPTKLVGVDRDVSAVLRAQNALAGFEAELAAGDFLELAPNTQLLLSDAPSPGALAEFGFDAIVSNPPYVRTQVLGAARARTLAERFALSGRVDLYQAFVRAMTPSLRLGGILGLLCSNRFLTIQSGEALRRLLSEEFELLEIVDLGDTKLFSAAVLPAIVIARRTTTSGNRSCAFTRVYECEPPATPIQDAPSVLAALEQGLEGIVSVDQRCYEIERGELNRPAGSNTPWRISHARRERWLKRIEARTDCTLGDVGEIRVGIKTTADKVFIRRGWDDLPPEIRPEPELLHPLLTHHLAERWRARDDPSKSKTVLYPHEAVNGKRCAVDLARYPRGRAYLETHRETLAARSYVIQAGRAWYEIWVPQQPDAWAKQKIVFPDISDVPRFFLDSTGAIVNGDCYWMALPQDYHPEDISVVLAVANSSFAIAFYDAVCGNRLYAGRRRFITQYVKRFPLPAADDSTRSVIHRLVTEVCALPSSEPEERENVEAQIDALVWEGFGLHEEVVR